MHLLHESNIGLDRKMLADLAVREPDVFEQIVQGVKPPAA